MPTVLIVDRDTKDRASTAGLVESLGYRTAHASTVADALNQLEQDDPAFVLLGFELDDATGLEALASIREIDRDLPVIMLAADLWDARVPEAMRQGAVAYLARPFGANDLREVFGRR